MKKEEEHWSSCRGFRTSGGKAGSSPVLLPMAVEMISVKKLTESSGKYAFVVECRPLDGKQQQQREEVTRSRKFECKGWDDLEAQSKTLRFVMATDSLSAFRAFLFNEPPGGGREEVVARSDGSTTVGSTIGRTEGGGGATTIMLPGAFPGKIDSQGSIQINIRSYVCVRQKQLSGPRYAVALCRLENGRLRAMSFHEQQGSTVDEEGLRTGAEDQAVDRAVLFLRSMAFESWRKHGGIEALLREQQQQQQASATLGQKRGRERGLKHPCSVVEMRQGKKVDCLCGKNRSRGPMIACERCGALEHAECRGFRSGKQVIIPTSCFFYLRLLH